MSYTDFNDGDTPSGDEFDGNWEWGFWGQAVYDADTGGDDTYEISVTPTIDSYLAGMPFRFKVTTGNTGACSLNVNSKGAKTIKKFVSDDLGTGDILAGQVVSVVYDGTNFQLLNPVEKSGIIKIWNGTIATIPTGWVLCDGNNGTPNLIDRFVICAKEDDAGSPKTNVTGSLTVSGGSDDYDLSHTHTTGDHSLTEAELASHAHDIKWTDSGVTPGDPYMYVNGERTTTNGISTSETTGSGDAHNHGATSSELSATQNVMNPYYALAYIMKL